jgi:hypothetical protein
VRPSVVVLDNAVCWAIIEHSNEQRCMQHGMAFRSTTYGKTIQIAEGDNSGR